MPRGRVAHGTNFKFRSSPGTTCHKSRSDFAQKIQCVLRFCFAFAKPRIPKYVKFRRVPSLFFVIFGRFCGSKSRNFIKKIKVSTGSKAPELSIQSPIPSWDDRQVPSRPGTSRAYTTLSSGMVVNLQDTEYVVKSLVKKASKNYGPEAPMRWSSSE